MNLHLVYVIFFHFRASLLPSNIHKLWSGSDSRYVSHIHIFCGIIQNTDDALEMQRVCCPISVITRSVRRLGASLYVKETLPVKEFIIHWFRKKRKIEIKKSFTSWSEKVINHKRADLEPPRNTISLPDKDSQPWELVPATTCPHCPLIWCHLIMGWGRIIYYLARCRPHVNKG